MTTYYLLHPLTDGLLKMIGIHQYPKGLEIVINVLLLLY